MKKELKITAIMRDCQVNRKKAEEIFNKEICERFHTNDIKLAEAMFNTSRRTK